MNSDVLNLLNQIFQVCIIPLLGILTVYLTTFIKKKSDELASQTDNALYQKYIKMLAETVSTAVTATNQCYVNALKSKNAFDKEAQEQAFAQTKNIVLKLLSTEAQKYLQEMSGDLSLLIQQSIEAEVNKQKSENATVIEASAEGAAAATKSSYSFSKTE